MLKQFIGCKIISADKMTLGDFNKFKGVKTGKDEDADAEGYFVLYPDGYYSWSPANTFDTSYREITKDEIKLIYGVKPVDPFEDGSTFAFGVAIMMLNSGQKVARKGWNGKGMYLFLPKDMTFGSEQNLDDLSDEVKVNPCIAMKTSDGSVVIGWLASQDDMLSEDWYVVNS